MSPASSDTTTSNWDSPWFMGAFLCLALAAGLFWQSVQIEAHADRSIEQLFQSGTPSQAG